MKISLAMIVKNEEGVLERCLRSVCGAIDDIVIVDTGSIDNTVAIARQYTDKIFSYRWRGSFSEARNFSIEQCKHPWILMLDADEFLDSTSINNMFDYVKNTSYDAFVLVHRHYLEDFYSESLKKLKWVTDLDILKKTGFRFPVYSEVLKQIRLFRNHLRLKGDVYEWFDTENKKVLPDVLIHHTGYSNRKVFSSKIHKYGKLLKLQADKIINLKQKEKDHEMQMRTFLNFIIASHCYLEEFQKYYDYYVEISNNEKFKSYIWYDYLYLTKQYELLTRLGEQKTIHFLKWCEQEMNNMKYKYAEYKVTARRKYKLLDSRKFRDII